MGTFLTPKYAKFWAYGLSSVARSIFYEVLADEPNVHCTARTYRWNDYGDPEVGVRIIWS
jgi:hypothetical protein